MITVRFFAMLKGPAGTDSREFAVPTPATVGGLKAVIATEMPSLKDVIGSRSLLVSVNQEFATDRTPVKDGDEVGFLPPFSGG